MQSHESDIQMLTPQVSGMSYLPRQISFRAEHKMLHVFHRNQRAETAEIPNGYNSEYPDCVTQLTLQHALLRTRLRSRYGGLNTLLFLTERHIHHHLQQVQEHWN